MSNIINKMRQASAKGSSQSWGETFGLIVQDYVYDGREGFILGRRLGDNGAPQGDLIKVGLYDPKNGINGRRPISEMDPRNGAGHPVHPGGIVAVESAYLDKSGQLWRARWIKTITSSPQKQGGFVRGLMHVLITDDVAENGVKRTHVRARRVWPEASLLIGTPNELEQALAQALHPRREEFVDSPMAIVRLIEQGADPQGGDLGAHVYAYSKLVEDPATGYKRATDGKTSARAFLDSIQDETTSQTWGDFFADILKNHPGVKLEVIPGMTLFAGKRTVEHLAKGAALDGLRNVYADIDPLNGNAREDWFVDTCLGYQVGQDNYLYAVYVRPQHSESSGYRPFELKTPHLEPRCIDGDTRRVRRMFLSQNEKVAVHAANGVNAAPQQQAGMGMQNPAGMGMAPNDGNAAPQQQAGMGMQNPAGMGMASNGMNAAPQQQAGMQSPAGMGMAPNDGNAAPQQQAGMQNPAGMGAGPQTQAAGVGRQQPGMGVPGQDGMGMPPTGFPSDEEIRIPPADMSGMGHEQSVSPQPQAMAAGAGGGLPPEDQAEIARMLGHGGRSKPRM